MNYAAKRKVVGSDISPPLHGGRRVGQRFKRALAPVVVCSLLATGLVVLDSVVDVPPAHAQFATGGEGRHQDLIDWFEWGSDNAAIPKDGETVTNQRDVNGHILATTCTVSDISATMLGTSPSGLQVYRSGGWTGDALDNLYNVGGTGTANKLVTGLANSQIGAYVKFHFSCYVTLDGEFVPLQGLVVADAEASNTGYRGLYNEFMRAKPDQKSTWRIIDRYRSPGCESYTEAVLSEDTSLRFQTNKLECHEYNNATGQGPVAVGFMQGATSATVDLQGGGKSAVALGVVLPADFGDAPASYGQAGSLYTPGWTGGELAIGTTNVFADDFTIGKPTLPKLLLGDTIDPEATPQISADALGDDRDDTADEDAVSITEPIGAIPGEEAKIPPLTCQGIGKVAGWIDWNANGVFDQETERSEIADCVAGKAELKWTQVPKDVITSKRTYMRLWMSDNVDDFTTTTGLGLSGEVEDHPVAVETPQLKIEKSSNATPATVVGDTVTYTVKATNTSKQNFTAKYPAVVVDDLTGVLDEATFNNDALASQPGALKYTEPQLSWSGSLAAGASVELKYTVKLKAGGDGTVRNVAWRPKDPSVPNPAPPACGAGETDAVTGEPCAVVDYLLPKLTVQKGSDHTDLPADGELITYTVKVTNNGPGVADGSRLAKVTDDLTDVLDDAEFVDSSLKASVGNVSRDGNNLIWTGPLGTGEAATITYQVKYSSTLGGSHVLNNTACVPSEMAVNPADACSHWRIPAAALEQWKQVAVDPSPAVAGSKLKYTLFFRNSGLAPAAVDSVDFLNHVTDDADVSVEPVGNNGLTATRTDNKIAITGTVPAGITAQVTYEVTVKADGARGDNLAANFLVPNNPASPPSPPADPSCNPANPAKPDCTSTPVGELVTKKAVVASSDPVVVGSTLDYALTFHNVGKAPIRVAQVDHLGKVLDDGDVTGVPVSSDSVLTVSKVVDGKFSIDGTLQPGQLVTVSYRVTVKAGGDHQADNFLVPAGVTPPDTCVAGDAHCTSTPIPHLSVVKAADPVSGISVVAGQEVTYTLKFTSDGAASSRVDYVDRLSGVTDDAELTEAPTSSDPALTVTDGSDGKVNITGDLAPGKEVTVTYKVTVKADGSRGDNELGNVLAARAITDPKCGEDGVSCTSHPIGELAAWKSVDPVSGATVSPGNPLTYTLHFENTGKAPVKVEQVDHLTRVLDDADITTAPVAADPALTVSAVAAGQFNITGELEPGKKTTVTYTVTVKPTGELGDDRLDNFLLPSGLVPPVGPCVPAGERPTCTVNHVSDVGVVKASDPDSGSNVNPGDKITYTLTFTNRSVNLDAEPGAVDYTDHLKGVVDDAVLTGAPVASDANLTATSAADEITIVGKIPAGKVYTVKYTVEVKPYDQQGDHQLENVVAVTGFAPVCAEGSQLCTNHQVPPPVPADLPRTGASIPLGLVLAGLLSLIGGTALLYTSRRRLN